VAARMSEQPEETCGGEGFYLERIHQQRAEDKEMTATMNEALQADYEHKQILVKELTKNLEERGEELTRYKNVLMNILEVSLIYSGTEEMDGIAFTIRDFVEKEARIRSR